MKKLSLDLAGLQVESFETFVPEDRRGTVRANSGCETYSCPGTCGIVPDSTPAKDGDFAGTLRLCSGNCCA
jgi:hypothetical protein